MPELRIVAEVLTANPSYTHIVLGKEEGWPEGQAYFTRAGRYQDSYGFAKASEWIEVAGHYNMGILAATEDFIARLTRGY